MPSNFLTSFVKRMRQMFLGMKEKESVRIDELVLEHLLLYHGLIGTSPENQREFKDVQADIYAALADRSTGALGIALKLPPLLWEDKLRTIFQALSLEQKKMAVDLLAPDESKDVAASSTSPINHNDWRVRANAANVLAILQAKQTSAKLAPLLNDTTDNGKLSFCHIAYALGKLQTEAGKIALAKHIQHPEAWLQVDVAGALSFYPLETIGSLLAQALQSENELKDYMAVAISKRHLPEVFLSADDDQLKDAGCELILGILAACEHSFGQSIVWENRLPECLKVLVDQATAAPKSIRVAAALALVHWLLEAGKSPADSKELLMIVPSQAILTAEYQKLFSQEISVNILNNLRQDLDLISNQGKRGLASPRHSIKLAGQMRLVDAEPLLLSVLQIDFPFLDEVVEALGLIGQPTTLPALIKLANETVDVEERNERSKSKQPVLEDHPAQAKIYWTILKALGNFADPKSAKFLLAATSDFAPDKRAQALSALVSLVSKDEGRNIYAAEIQQVLSAGLHDSSPLVQLAALEGAVRLTKDNLINEMALLLDSRENTVSQQALAALSKIAEKGHSAGVAKILRTKLKTEREEYKKQRIQEFLKKW